MADFGDATALGVLPVLAVEEPGRLEARPVDAVETARVDGESIRPGARHIECVHAAMRAEGVLRHAGAEGVHRERVLAAQQLEIFRHRRQMENALLGAYRAAALRQPVQIDLGAETHAAAVASALTLFEHRRHSLVWPLLQGAG